MGNDAAAAAAADAGVYRNRKALESRSLADDERITFLETQLKEAKYIAEDADRKYDEVSCFSTLPGRPSAIIFIISVVHEVQKR